MSEWEQIHSQINAIVRAIPEHFLLDPPDGGDVTVAEGVQRMATRIAQLEAALRPLACTCDAKHQADCSRSEVDCPFWNARAALEDRT